MPNEFPVENPEFLAEFICESNAIEGIKTNQESVFDEIKRGREDGHVGAMLMLAEAAHSLIKTYLDKEMICLVNGLIMKEQARRDKEAGKTILFPGKTGDYRTVRVRVGNNLCHEPELVPVMMSGWLTRVKNWQEGTQVNGWDFNLRYIAKFHLEFELCHPFIDGNGRTGRALAYFMMKFARLKPFVFTSHDKVKKYYSCFDQPAVNARNTEMMIDYFKEKFQEAVRGEKGT